jgi:NAD(P)-dependent dehydrogenase (short-subunit alcohol dehydrogenase family)
MGDVIVVIGLGGMGAACARRLGSGRQLVVADVDPKNLEKESAALVSDGYSVESHTLDVTDQDALATFASSVSDLGTLRTLVHTAGLSPTMAPAKRILEVDMMGTEYVLSAFLPIATAGTVAVCIASNAGYISGLSPEQKRSLASAESEDLMSLVAFAEAMGGGASYCIAKCVNLLRIEQAAIPWGAKGARVVSISPGQTSTPMNRKEIEEGATESMQQQLQVTPLQRLGTPHDIAAAVEWLASPAASFVTGCDLRIDGGVTGALYGFGMG